jgi:hypothetical protein
VSSAGPGPPEVPVANPGTTGSTPLIDPLPLLSTAKVSPAR